MARAEGAIICLLIVAMDVAAGVLGIEAEEAQNKGKHLRVFFECKEPVRQAYECGLTAAALLGLSHAIAKALGGCTCIGSSDQWDRSFPNKKMAAVTLIISWIVVIVGFTMLIIGAMWNSLSQERLADSLIVGFCRRGILCFVHALFCLVYYVSANASIREVKDVRSHGVHCLLFQA